MPNLVHLDGVYLGKDHVALKLPRFEMDFRSYLRYQRKPEQLN
jgi:hypothetical protein